MTGRSIVLAAALTVLSCGTKKPDQAVPPAGKPPEGTVAERLTGVKLGDVEVIDQQGDGDAGILVVVGENHASIASQLEVESTLSALAAGKQLDAVGVEGSLGPIPVHAAQIDELSSLSSVQRRTHARELIE